LRDRRAGPLSYRLLWSFGAGQDGYGPQASVIDVDGTLYGTTLLGGMYGAGIVYSFTVGTSAEKTVHNFGLTGDGGNPAAGLIDVNGTLYGTTVYGGEYNQGAVYSITTDGTENVLYSFGSKGSDGAFPLAALIDVKGTLYGTTPVGGAYGNGTVYSVTTLGVEKVLHSFGKGTDGSLPVGSLIDVGDTMYGATQEGGGRHCYHTSYVACGTVFSITTKGTEKVLHSFGKGTDGRFPYAGLMDVDGTLYGTTKNGGKYYQGGTVYSITTRGTEKVLHSFGKRTDGNFPAASLIDVGGTLYGTTAGGGLCFNCGTVFSITTDGTEKVLHRFGNGIDGRPDGVQPYASLIDVHGTLYGTTEGGGFYSRGTLFSLKP
jgi:uncharacterized repeat protein (TIGR03803 family)